VRLGVVAVAVAAAGLAAAAPPARHTPGGETTAGQMPMDHRTPLYREGTFHALVGAVLIAGGLLVYRGLRARPRRRAGPAGFVSEAILAADLVDSTRLATHYGEAVALRARNGLEEQVGRLSETSRRFLETTGDGCLVTFPGVAPALAVAQALLRERHERPVDLGASVRVDIRVGLTYGEILLDARGVRHGAAINKAYRLLGVKPRDLVELKAGPETTSLAEGTRILVDEDAAQEAGDAAALRFVGYARLRGFSGLHGVYEATGPGEPRPTAAAAPAPAVASRGSRRGEGSR
jgi:hypothetical protein